MSRMRIHNVTEPDEIRTFANGRVDLVKLGELAVGKGIFEPGWRWSRSLKAIMGTDSCQAEHMLYVLSGRMAIAMDNGEQREIQAGDFCIIPAGHDAWVVGNEPCELVDFGGFEDYAKPRTTMPERAWGTAAAGDEIGPAL